MILQILVLSTEETKSPQIELFEGNIMEDEFWLTLFPDGRLWRSNPAEFKGNVGASRH